MPLSVQKVTAEMLFQMSDDGSRYELIRGEVKKMTPAGGKHGAIVVNLTLPLGSFVKSRQLGVVFGAGTGFRIFSNPDTVRAPDSAFIAADRIPRAGSRTRFGKAPPIWPQKFSRQATLPVKWKKKLRTGCRRESDSCGSSIRNSGSSTYIGPWASP